MEKKKFLEAAMAKFKASFEDIQKGGKYQSEMNFIFSESTILRVSIDHSAGTPVFYHRWCSVSKLEDPILIALDHVRTVFPHVTMVVYNKQGEHQYMSDHFEQPTFDERIDLTLIEDACDAVPTLPFVFHPYTND